MIEIFLVAGVPASGKSFVCEKLTHRFEYVHHDGFIYLKQPGTYLSAVLQAAKTATKPLLIEAPFSVSGIKDPLEKAGFRVTPCFIVEKEPVLRKRYEERNRKETHIIQGHLSRQKTFKKRAIEMGAFYGTSTEVLDYLSRVPL